MRHQYRIVTDPYAGYEVQYRTWLWPFWMQPTIATFRTVEEAEAFARKHARAVVKDLGWLP